MHLEGICSLKQELNSPFKQNYTPKIRGLEVVVFVQVVAVTFPHKT